MEIVLSPYTLGLKLDLTVCAPGGHTSLNFGQEWIKCENINSLKAMLDIQISLIACALKDFDVFVRVKI